jgi:hypothetical protein
VRFFFLGKSALASVSWFGKGIGNGNQQREKKKGAAPSKGIVPFCKSRKRTRQAHAQHAHTQEGKEGDVLGWG